MTKIRIGLVRWPFLAMEAFHPIFNPETLVKYKERTNCMNQSPDLDTHAAMWEYAHMYTH